MSEERDGGWVRRGRVRARRMVRRKRVMRGMVGEERGCGRRDRGKVGEDRVG